MGSHFRPFLTSWLCGLVLLGHIPALLHVVTCESQSQLLPPSTKSAGTVSLCCLHGHSEHAPHGGHASETTSQEEHHSDSCRVCQSLYSPAGVPAVFAYSCLALAPFVHNAANHWARKMDHPLQQTQQAARPCMSVCAAHNQPTHPVRQLALQLGVFREN